MSNTRNLDQNLLDLLRDMRNRIAALESHNSKVRRNDIRLGDIVVAAEDSKGALSLTNLNDKSVEYLGIPEPAIFSYHGALTVSSSDDDYAPLHVVPKATTATEIVLALRVAATTDTVVNVWFNNGNMMKTVTLPADELVTVLGVVIPVGRNETIYPQLVTAGTGARGLSVTVRFGLQRNTEQTADDDLV